MNNNLKPSISRRCKCGRYITIGEEKAGIGIFGYECPDCIHQKYSKQISREDYYKKFNLSTK